MKIETRRGRLWLVVGIVSVAWLIVIPTIAALFGFGGEIWWAPFQITWMVGGVFAVAIPLGILGSKLVDWVGEGKR